jgi:hypothetical protein
MPRLIYFPQVIASDAITYIDGRVGRDKIDQAVEKHWRNQHLESDKNITHAYVARTCQDGLKETIHYGRRVWLPKA